MKSAIAKKWLIASSGLVVLAALITIMVIAIMNKTTSLTKEQVTALREKYPICAEKIPASLSMRKPTLERVKESSETFVYGKIEGEVETYNKTISTGNSQLDKKWAEHGITGDTKFFRYNIKVINDSENMMETGEEIQVWANYIFVDYYPRFFDDMEVVIPVSAITNDDGYPYNAVGSYYVTEDGFAISAFDEVQAQVEDGSGYSGLRVEELLNNLKKP